MKKISLEYSSVKKIFDKVFRLFAVLLAICALSACQKYYLSLNGLKINEQYLSSVHVNTPDKRRQAPPVGEIIVMDWRIPKAVLERSPVIHLHLVYHNYSQETLFFPIHYKMGYVTHKNIDLQHMENQGVLSFAAQIVLDDGTIYKDWYHQLYTELIALDREDVENRL